MCTNNNTGNLYTVGGIGDSNANPVSPLLSAPQPLPSFVEDELYSLIPFVTTCEQTSLPSVSWKQASILSVPSPPVPV